MKKKRSKHLHIGWVIFIILLILGFLLFLGFIFTVLGILSLSLGEGVSSDGEIALIEVKGVISSDGYGDVFTQTQSSEHILEQLDAANEDPFVDAILLKINSPGGAVVPSKLIAEKVKELDKPTIAYIQDVGASGGYWIASAADYIVADELSMTGSISVIGSYLVFEDLMEEYGVYYEELVTGKYKDLGTPYQKLNYEERNLVQGRLDSIHDFFVASVAENRGMTYDEIQALATGEVFLGLEAKELGLVDDTGNFDDAFDKAEEIANLNNAALVEFSYEPGFFEILSGSGVKFGEALGKGFASALVEEEFSVSV